MIWPLTTTSSLLVREKGKINSASGEKNKELLAACREFEAIFYQQLLKGMRSTVMESGWLDGGTGEDVFRDLLDAEYAKLMAEKNSRGLADMIYRQLSRE